MIRAPKSKHEFHTKRDGDTITVETHQQRAYLMSAFINWKRGKPGNLRATSKKTPAGYEITFTGVSPAEAKEDI